jgi:hypothetical protein
MRVKLNEDPEQINKFHEGLLARKKEGFKDIKEEASYLFSQMKNFNVEEVKGFEWNRLAMEIEYLESQFKPKSVLEIFD